MSQHELDAIKNDLQSIINELEDIASGIKRDFIGIGNEQCASVIIEEAERYRKVKRKLDGINISKIKEEHAKKNVPTACVPTS